MTNDNQIIKCRDDKAPVILNKVPSEAGAEIAFKLAEGSACSWLSKDQTVGPDKLRPRIEPWLTALFQSEHFSLLVGSGLTHAIHWMAAGKALPGMSSTKFSHYNDEINAEAKKSAEAVGRESGNIEDQIRVANELLRGLEIIVQSDANLKVKADGLRDDLSKVLADFAASILTGENGLITANAEKLENTFNYLVSFSAGLDELQHLRRLAGGVQLISNHRQAATALR